MPLPSYANTIFSYALSNLQNQVRQRTQEALQKQEMQWQQVQRIQETGSKMIDDQGKQLDRRRAFMQEAGKAAGQLGLEVPESTDAATAEYGALGGLQGMASERERAEREAFKRQIELLRIGGRAALLDDRQAGTAEQKTIDYRRSVDKLPIAEDVALQGKKDFWDYTIDDRKAMAAASGSRTAADKLLDRSTKVFDATDLMVKNLNNLSAKLAVGGANIFQLSDLESRFSQDQSDTVKGAISGAISAAANSLAQVTGRSPTVADKAKALNEAITTLDAGMATIPMTDAQRAQFNAIVRQGLQRVISGQNLPDTTPGVSGTGQPQKSRREQLKGATVPKVE